MKENENTNGIDDSMSMDSSTCTSFEGALRFQFALNRVGIRPGRHRR